MVQQLHGKILLSTFQIYHRNVYEQILAREECMFGIYGLKCHMQELIKALLHVTCVWKVGGSCSRLIQITRLMCLKVGGGEKKIDGLNQR